MSMEKIPLPFTVITRAELFGVNNMLDSPGDYFYQRPLHPFGYPDNLSMQKPSDKRREELRSDIRSAANEIKHTSEDAPKSTSNLLTNTNLEIAQNIKSAQGYRYDRPLIPFM